MKYLITEDQRNELVKVLAEIQAKFSFNAIKMLADLPPFIEGAKEKDVADKAA